MSISTQDTTVSKIEFQVSVLTGYTCLSIDVIKLLQLDGVNGQMRSQGRNETMTKDVIIYNVYISSLCMISDEKIAEFSDKDTAMQYAYECIHGEHTDDYEWYLEDHEMNSTDDDDPCSFYVEAHEHYDIYDYLQEEWLDNEIIAYIEQN